MSRKKLTREDYKKIFDELFLHQFNWIPKPNEKIVQCNDKYPPYWFISNYGYLISVYNNKVKILKPYATPVGTKNKDGNYTHRDFVYVRYNKHFKLHLLIIEHFHQNEFEDLPEYAKMEVDGHHKTPRTQFNDNQPQLCDNAFNTQPLPTGLHTRVTNVANGNFQKQVDKAPTVYVPEGTLEKIFKTMMNNSDAVEASATILDNGTGTSARRTKNVKFIFKDEEEN